MLKTNKVLFHYKLGFPKGFNSKVGVVALTYTRHAIDAALERRIELALTLNTDTAQAIEAELEHGQVTKIVYRTKLDDRRDIVLVVIPIATGFLVKTVWINMSNDTHNTLDESKYSKPLQKNNVCSIRKIA